MSKIITDEMVEAGAQALREHEQGHRRLNPWSLVPKGQRKPWQEKARIVLEAALRE